MCISGLCWRACPAGARVLSDVSTNNIEDLWDVVNIVGDNKLPRQVDAYRQIFWRSAHCVMTFVVPPPCHFVTSYVSQILPPTPAQTMPIFGKQKREQKPVTIVLNYLGTILKTVLRRATEHWQSHTRMGVCRCSGDKANSSCGSIVVTKSPSKRARTPRSVLKTMLRLGWWTDQSLRISAHWYTG